MYLFGTKQLWDLWDRNLSQQEGALPNVPSEGQSELERQETRREHDKEHPKPKNNIKFTGRRD